LPPMKTKRAALYSAFRPASRPRTTKASTARGPRNRAWGESPSVRRNSVAATGDGWRADTATEYHVCTRRRVRRGDRQARVGGERRWREVKRRACGSCRGVAISLSRGLAGITDDATFVAGSTGDRLLVESSGQTAGPVTARTQTWCCTSRRSTQQPLPAKRCFRCSAVFSEFERSMIVARVNAGIARRGIN